MTNVQISKFYALKVKNNLNDGGIWISNLNEIRPKEAKKIVLVYKKIFKDVKYDVNTGFVVCTK